MNIDVWEVIWGASSKPFGFMPFYPGPGLGGQSIPIDPLYLEWKSKINVFESRFVGMADAINSSMPRFVVTRVMELLNEHGKAVCDSRVHVLGVTYKKDISDSRESPALEIIKLLTALKAAVSYSDPYVSSLQLDGRRMEAIPPGREVLAASDIVIIVTNHSVFDYQEIVRYAPLIFDTRNATEGLRSKKLVRL
jgi:UDP-N-acetyl-D-glucosamine dehydrogenase